jgi:glutamate synthase (NADPH) large chain
MRKHVAATGKGPIGSMGHQGPLACMDPGLSNVSDYFKENVAVVTNPAIDREREAEHFSTAVILGDRPDNPDHPPVGCASKPPSCSEASSPRPCPPWTSWPCAGSTAPTPWNRSSTFFTAQQRDPSRMAILDATYDPGAGIGRAPCGA